MVNKYSTGYSPWLQQVLVRMGYSLCLIKNFVKVNPVGQKPLNERKKSTQAFDRMLPLTCIQQGAKAYFRMQLLSAHNWVHNTCHLGSSESFLSPIALTCFWKEYFGSDFVNKSAWFFSDPICCTSIFWNVCCSCVKNNFGEMCLVLSPLM